MTVSCIKRQVMFERLAIAVVLLLIGSISTVLFKLIACAKVGNDSVHLHFGCENCFGLTWYASLTMLILIVFPFSTAFIKLKVSEP